jgi:hypothetical protein
MRRSIATGAVAALCALAGCGDSGYSQATEDNFLEGCTSNTQVTKSYCQCLYDTIKKKIPYEDFKKLDESIGTSKTAPAGAREEFNAAVKSCRSKL